MGNGSDLDRLDAGPSELTAGQRRGLVWGLLVAIALVVAVIAPGPVSLVDPQPADNRYENQAVSEPSDAVRPIVFDAAEVSGRTVRVSILDWPRTARDALPEWVVAKIGPAVADSARFAATHAGFDVFVAGTQSSPCLIAISRSSRLIDGDCVTDVRFFVRSGDDSMSVSAVEVDCALDVVLVPDDYKLKVRHGSVVSTGPNVAIVAPDRISPHVYGLQTPGQATMRFSVGTAKESC